MAMESAPELTYQFPRVIAVNHRQSLEGNNVYITSVHLALNGRGFDCEIDESDFPINVLTNILLNKKIAALHI